MNEQGRVAYSPLPEFGAGRFTFDGIETEELPWDASNAAILAALEAHPSIGAGNILVDGTIAAGQVDYEFTGALANINLGQITWTSSTLGAFADNGGSSNGLDVVSVQEPDEGENLHDITEINIVDGATGGTWLLEQGGVPPSRELAWNASNEDVQTAIFDELGVTVSVEASQSGTGWRVEWTPDYADHWGAGDVDGSGLTKTVTVTPSTLQDGASGGGSVIIPPALFGRLVA